MRCLAREFGQNKGRPIRGSGNVTSVVDGDFPGKLELEQDFLQVELVFKFGAPCFDVPPIHSNSRQGSTQISGLFLPVASSDQASSHPPLPPAHL